MSNPVSSASSAAARGLPDSREMLAGVIAGSLDGVYVFEGVRNDAGRIVDFEWILANPQSERIMKRAPETLIGKRLLEVFPGVRPAGLFEAYVRTVETGEPYDDELYYSQEGLEGWFRVTAVKLRDGCTVTFQNITESKRAEWALRESEERYRQMFEKNQAVKLVLDPATGQILEANSAAAKFYGYDRRRLTTMNIKEINIAPEEEVEQALADLVTRPASYATFRHRLASGEVRDVEVYTGPVREDGALRLYSIIHDITERRRAERALRQSERRYKQLVEQATDIIYRADAQGYFQYANRVAVRLTGYAEDELVGMHFLHLIRPDYWPEAADFYVRQIETGQQNTYYEFPLITRDGHTRWIGQNVQLLREGDGRVTGVQAVARDVTERVRAERALERTNAELKQRNRELQDFAYIASHDLQEPLRKVRAFAALMLEDYHEAVDQTGRYYLDRMRDAAERMSGLITSLLSYSRVTTQGQPFEPVNLNAIAAEVRADLELRIQETGGRLEIGSLPTLEADPTQMRQLLQNLIGNALKFHREGVPPVVHLWADLSPEHILPEPPTGQVFRLFVRDNGVGFKKKYLDRIFTPFQRLHPRSQYAGTGMGLAICRRIIERHHGTIDAESTPGQGSTFILTLPFRQPGADPDIAHEKPKP